MLFVGERAEQNNLASSHSTILNNIMGRSWTTSLMTSTLEYVCVCLCIFVFPEREADLRYGKTYTKREKHIDFTVTTGSMFLENDWPWLPKWFLYLVKYRITNHSLVPFFPRDSSPCLFKDGSILNFKGNTHLGGGFQYFLFSPLPGEIIWLVFFKWVETTN